MSSDETSIESETKPSVQTVVGTSRQVASGVLMEGVLPGARLIDAAYRTVNVWACVSSIFRRRPGGNDRKELASPRGRGEARIANDEIARALRCRGRERVGLELIAQRGLQDLARGGVR